METMVAKKKCLSCGLFKPYSCFKKLKSGFTKSPFWLHFSSKKPSDSVIVIDRYSDKCCDCKSHMNAERKQRINEWADAMPV